VLVVDPERERPLVQEGVGVTVRASSSISIEISISSVSLSSAMERGIPGDMEGSPGEGGEGPNFGYRFGGARRPEEKNAE
jgi:hypothetical protein